jgi:ribosomal protein S26
MPISRAPYKRTYKHRTARGKEYRIRCEFCKRLVPRYKTFVITKSLPIARDPSLRKQIDRRFVHVMRRKIRVCPACARFRGIVQPGKSVRRKRR